MSEFKTVVRKSDVAAGETKRLEVDGHEILLANVGGAFHAVADRCGHMCASLSGSQLHGTEVTCKFHGAKFDVTTGKAVAHPAGEGIDQVRGYLQSLGLPDIKTHDLQRYEARVEGDDVQIRLP